MKRYIYIPASVLAVIAASSCDYTFDLKDFDSDPALFIECVPGVSDTTLIKVFVAEPLNSPESSFGSIDRSKTEVSMEINGQSVRVKRAEKDTWTMRENWFYVVEDFMPGDRVSVSASLDGIAPVTAETVVPEKFPECEVSIIPVSTQRHWVQVDADIKVHDTDAAQNYYGMQLIMHTSYNDMDNNPVEREEIMLMESSPYDDMSYVDKLMTVYGNGTERMIIWDGSAFASGHVLMRMSDSIPDDGGSGHMIRFRFRLFRLSPALFRYYTAQYNTGNGSGTESDLFSPPYNAYTNVHGGFGILGAMTLSQTDWIELMEE